MVRRRNFGTIPGTKTVIKRTRQEKVLKFRRAGYSIREIAELVPECNGAKQVRADLREVLREMVEEPAQELIALQYHRMETLIRSIWREAIRGDLYAHDRILKLIEAQNKLLRLGSQGEDGASDVERWLNSLVNTVAESESGDLEDD